MCSQAVNGKRWQIQVFGNKRDTFSCAACGKSFTVACPHCSAAVTRRQNVLSDFLIGAHAVTYADCLLTRDLGVYRSNFPELKIKMDRC